MEKRPTVVVAVADGVGRLTLDHPPVNVLTRAVLRELRTRLAGLAAAADLRVLILGAEGRHFSAGADVGEHLPPDCESMIPEFLETIEAVVGFPVPVLAAVRGKCLGGGFELVQAADIVIAAESAAFGQPEIALGVFPPAASVVLPTRCSWGPTAELLYTGDPVGAEKAHALGLVTRVVLDEVLEDEAQTIARRIARHSAAALRETKAALRAGAPPWAAALAESGRRYLERLMETRDAVEGLRAFLDKREPVWAHR